MSLSLLSVGNQTDTNLWHIKSTRCMFSFVFFTSLTFAVIPLIVVILRGVKQQHRSLFSLPLVHVVLVYIFKLYTRAHTHHFIAARPFHRGVVEVWQDIVLCSWWCLPSVLSFHNKNVRNEEKKTMWSFLQDQILLIILRNPTFLLLHIIFLHLV